MMFSVVSRDGAKKHKKKRAAKTWSPKNNKVMKNSYLELVWMSRLSM